jgi:hypothetical protein
MLTIERLIDATLNAELKVREDYLAVAKMNGTPPDELADYVEDVTNMQAAIKMWHSIRPEVEHGTR